MASFDVQQLSCGVSVTLFPHHVVIAVVALLQGLSGVQPRLAFRSS